MANLKLGLLGPLEVTVGGEPRATLESDKSRALLGYLAVESAQAHRREALVGLLWPECPEEAARRNLRQALYSLRNAIGDHDAKPPYLLISRDEIQFNTASDHSLDVSSFIALQDNCDKHLPRCEEDCAVHAARLEDAISLYRGPFLQEFFLKDSAEFEEWAARQREALHRRVLDTLTYLANYSERGGEYLAARRWALRLLELDPWREEAHRQIMRVLAASGERGEALAQYETCRQVLLKELGIEPSAETRELYQEIKGGKIGMRRPERDSTSPSIRPALPLQTTPFIGRERELEELDRLLANPECRIVTLIGPGGIGKTRLALQAAARSSAKFRHGVAFAALAPVTNVGSIIPAVAEGMGFSFYGPGDSQTQLLTYLREKELLLILDNVEQLMEGVCIWVEILVRAPHVKLLVTSRVSLNLQEEWVLELAGLPIPENDDLVNLEAYPAAALFLQRAGRAQVGFALGPHDRPALARLCRLVGGMPLALELAASWTRTLSVQDILQEIEHSLDFLAATTRDLPARHQSMRAVFDQSWRMLEPEEQRALRELSVFRGGFHRQAAEEVAGANLSHLSMLQSKSLVRRMASGRPVEGGSIRYDLHELVRQYASSKLMADEPEWQRAGESHSDYYLGLLEQRETKLRSSQQRQALDELTVDIDNIRAAWSWAVAHQNAARLCRVSHVLWYLYELKNWFAEGEQVFRQAAERLQSPQSEGEPGDIRHVAVDAMLAHSSYFSFRQGKIEEAVALLPKCADELRAAADPLPCIYALWYLGIVSWQHGEFGIANESLGEAWAKSRASGELYYESATGEFLGIVAHDQGDYPKARRYLADALAVARRLGDSMLIAHVLSYLCQTMLALGENEPAEKLLRESLALTRQIDYRFGEGMALDRLGQSAGARGAREEARALFEESLVILRKVGYPPAVARALNHQGFNWLDLQSKKEAKACFVEALRTAHESRTMISVLDALSGLAVTYAEDGDANKTLEIVLHVLGNPASTQEARNLASRVRTRIESQLTAEQIETAVAQARIESLEDVVEQALLIGT